MTRALAGFLFIVLSVTSSIGQNQFQRGLNWEDNRYNTLPVKYGSSGSLPPSKSIRQFFPRVVSQPRLDNTGAAWAAVWNCRTAAEAIACNQAEPSAVLKLAFSPAYNYGLIRKNPDCRDAISIIDLLESMVKNGSPYFSEYREFCVAEVSPDVYPLAKTKRLSGYIKLYNTSDPVDTKVRSVKQALNANSAVLAGMICPPSFQLAAEFWQPREQPDPQYGGHGVSVVGYDDTKFGGAFEIVNTWGKDWANAGFTWIRYKDFADFMPYAFSLFQVGGANCSTPVEGVVTFKAVSGKEMRAVKEPGEGQYRLEQSYPAGTQFSIIMGSNRPAYIYCFGVDPTNSYFPLFPRVGTTIPISFTDLKAPDDQPVIVLTDPPGRNLLYFIFSPVAIDLNNCMAMLKNDTNFSPAKLESVLATSRSTGTQWLPDKIAFSSSLSSPVAIKVVLDQK